jgi:hypothetical protein
LNGAFHQVEHVFEVNGLFEVICGPEFDGLYRGFDGAVAAHHDDRAVGGDAFDGAQGLKTVYARYPHVQEDHVGHVALDIMQGLLAVPRGDDVMAFVGENPRQGGEDCFLIVNEKNSSFFHRTAL